MAEHAIQEARDVAHEQLADRKLHTLFSALADPRRLFILRLLCRREGACVSEVAAACEVSVPAASQQLRVLERAGLLRRERAGQRIHYRVNRACSLVCEVMQLVQ